MSPSAEKTPQTSLPPSVQPNDVKEVDPIDTSPNEYQDARENLAPDEMPESGIGPSAQNDPIDKRNRVSSPTKSRFFAQESPKVIDNPWLFFNRGRVDRNELRYASEEEEEQDRQPYENSIELAHRDDDVADRAKPERQLSMFIPSMFREENRRKFTFFKKKKDKNEPNPVHEPYHDAATSDRANKLVYSLMAAGPSINLLASCLCEDEHGIARAPLLLSLLGFTISDTSQTPFTKNRKFRLDLEYGVGPQRLQWSVEKTAKDLLYLHSKFKIDNFKSDFSRTEELPRYPIPPLRLKLKNFRKTQDDHLQVERAASPIRTSQDDNHSVLSAGTFGGTLAQLRAHLSRASLVSEESPEDLRRRAQRNSDYISQVAKYLEDLVKIVELKAQLNRLFHFFEISPISALLSYETGFQGKQGVIHVGGNTKLQGWRVGHFKANDLKGMIDRRQEKWLLVRNTYVMYVNDINSTLPLEVFLVDPKFRVIVRGSDNHSASDTESDYEDNDGPALSHSHKVFKHLKITLENSERKLVLITRSEKEHRLWYKSLTDLKNSTVWAEPHRFESFAPIRKNCFAQWFVDARDYFWAVSLALEMAKDVIFIHDWWLSPELYLRRPANGNQQWRIDRILQRKAKQGVKIFVIVYRNVGTTVLTDSLYTKHLILLLNEENIHVIRSPNQLLQNTYFWAHHEKLCIIDHTVAFLGGIDLCYGRYDTPDHVLTDDSKVDFSSLKDSLSPEEFIKFQTFPGKDYSNPRVKDFYGLDKPYESMYDRDTVPRMPWHDVHMLTSGKVARDLARHFVQRWNYLLRQKRPSRFTPLLTPPPDLSDEEVRDMGLEGSCEVQLLRSSGNWSLGLKEHEQSIQNAYLKLIETSEHFVYIENQFFVTSCFIDGTEIHNRIGDALVDRIIKAHNENTAWRAVIVIPLMPGFESQVDEPDGSSVRVIMQCQYMSISRGATSIFAKLRKYGIDPDDYIQFFSLRKWGVIGPDRNLVTEQLYIHAKTMIVDDRLAIIGSANINERSMRGNRDSEVAAVVKDNETIATTMNGRPYLAGKFAHTLRMRLMREHLGVNVDVLDIVERRFKRFEQFASTAKGLQAATSKFASKENLILSAQVELAARDILGEPEGTFRWKNFVGDRVPENEEVPEEEDGPQPIALPLSFNNRTGLHEANKGIRDKKKHSYDARVQHNDTHKQDVYGDGPDKYRSTLAKRARLNSGRFLKDLAHKQMDQNPSGVFLPDQNTVREFLESDDFAMTDDMDTELEEIISARNRERWQLLKKISYLQRVAAIEKEQNDEENAKRSQAGFLLSNENNLPEPDEKVVGAVDVPNPTSLNDTESDTRSVDGGDDNVPVVTLNDKSFRDTIASVNEQGVDEFNSFIDPYGFEDPVDPEFYDDIWFDNARRNTDLFRLVFHCQPDDAVVSWKDYKEFSKLQLAFFVAQAQDAKHRRERFPYGRDSDDDDHKHKRGNSVAVDPVAGVGLLGDVPPLKGDIENFEQTNGYYRNNETNGTTEDNGPARRKRRNKLSVRRRANLGERIYERDLAKRLLDEIHGHLVLFPGDWLMRELEGGNWFYNTDRIPPIDIYD